MTSQKPAKLWLTEQEPIQGMQTKKYILILIMMFPSINTVIKHSVTFTGNILSEKMVMAFHTEYILKAALATSYRLLITQ